MSAPVAGPGRATRARSRCYYTEPMPRADEGPFLAEERKLLDAIAERIGHFVSRRRLQRVLAHDAPAARRGTGLVGGARLPAPDRPRAAGRLGRKMINHLCWSGVEEAERLLRDACRRARPCDEEIGEDNRPAAAHRPRPPTRRRPRPRSASPASTCRRTRSSSCIQSWIREDKSTFLKNALERLDTPLAELADALQRFRHGGVEEHDLSTATQMGCAPRSCGASSPTSSSSSTSPRSTCEVADFHELCQRIVYPPRSHGRLGGKSAGLFLASRIVARSPEYKDVLGDIRLPRSWHIPSDGILDFIHHNDLDDVYNRKYVDPDRVRLEYPYIVQLFKNSFFSPEILRGLSDVLDDLEGRPIIVRSSSLLEDRLGRGVLRQVQEPLPRQHRHQARAAGGAHRRHRRGLRLGLQPRPDRVPRAPRPARPARGDGHPDPGGGRHARRPLLAAGLLRRRLLEQRVPLVGRASSARTACCASCRASARARSTAWPTTTRCWSPPASPGLRVNQTPEEALRYSPKKADVINLETGVFETVDVHELLERHGDEMPGRAPADLDRRPRPPAPAGRPRRLRRATRSS